MELIGPGVTAPTGSLVERMRAEPSTCLLGLRSFWEGVDIPGDALRLLMIEKIRIRSAGRSDHQRPQSPAGAALQDPFADYLVAPCGHRIRSRCGTAAPQHLRSGSDAGARQPHAPASALCRHHAPRLTGPPAVLEVDSPEDAHRAVAGHLGLIVDDVWQERIDAIPGVETLSQAALETETLDAELNDSEIERRLEVARQWLGFDEWRPGQHDVMSRFMSGEE